MTEETPHIVFRQHTEHNASSYAPLIHHMNQSGAHLQSQQATPNVNSSFAFQAN